MSKIKLLIIAVIGLLIINIATITFLVLRKPTYPFVGKPRMGQEGPKNIIINKLHFDKEQVAEYEVLIKQHQLVIRRINDNIRTTKIDLYQSLMEENPASKELLLANLGSLQKQVELTHYNHFVAIRTICKPDQLQDYNTLTKELARFFAPEKREGPPPGN